MYEIRTDGKPHALLVARGLEEAGVEFLKHPDGRILVGDSDALDRIPAHWREGASIRPVEASVPRRTESGVQLRGAA